jgi:hypothetical protein
METKRDSLAPGNSKQQFQGSLSSLGQRPQDKQLSTSKQGQQKYATEERQGPRP